MPEDPFRAHPVNIVQPAADIDSDNGTDQNVGSGCKFPTGANSDQIAADCFTIQTSVFSGAHEAAEQNASERVDREVIFQSAFQFLSGNFRFIQRPIRPSHCRLLMPMLPAHPIMLETDLIKGETDMAKNEQTAVTKSETQQEPASTERGWGPFWSLRNEIDDLFDDFFPGTAIGPRRRSRMRGWPRWGGTQSDGMSLPSIDVIDKHDEIKLCAELPGMNEADIDVQVTDGVLTLSGEKKEETEEGDKEGDYYMSERSFGSFKRAVRLPEGIDQDKIEAHFENGVLTVRLPKSPEAQAQTRRIEVKSAK